MVFIEYNGPIWLSTYNNIHKNVVLIVNYYLFFLCLLPVIKSYMLNQILSICDIFGIFIMFYPESPNKFSILILEKLIYQGLVVKFD